MVAWIFCVLGVGLIATGAMLEHGPKNALILLGAVILLLAMGSFMRGSRPMGGLDDDQD